MRYLYRACFGCAFLVLFHEVVLADKEDKSDESLEVQDSPETTGGPLDSHEAMNNREINPITRKKRSYEFLMGLINNNSRYQVTRDEPAINLSKKQEESDEDLRASEPLLELMVKIAADPDQWSKVHNLLRQLDEDIHTSKQLVEEYRNHTQSLQLLMRERNLEIDKTKNRPPKKLTEEKKKKKYMQEEINKEVAITSDNGQPDINAGLFANSIPSTMSTREWPTFTDKQSRVNFVNTDQNSLTDQVKPASTGTSTTKAYPKYFSYHRVTGKPVSINRSPKAYIAVSVVAPKSVEERSGDDLELEHELRQLKPWTHSQNLRNMESIRSRWFIENEKNSKTST